ncbi:MAG: PQQ-binding-like beta-propeller repeat protein [Solirubrobacteraceae bacterium]
MTVAMRRVAPGARLVALWRVGLALACAATATACGSHGASTSTRQSSGTRSPATAPATGTAAESPSRAPAAPAAAVPDGDWSTFDYDAQRSGLGPAATGITAGDLHALRRRVVHIDGTVDASAIQMHAVVVGGRRRDVIVVTTIYGQTIALDPGSGQKLWEYTPSDIGSYRGSAQVTTSTPVADPDRRYVYAASPDGLIHKLALATGRQVSSGHWPVRITLLPAREKIASPLNISGPYVVAVTGGYYGDTPPYQGHVVMIDRTTGVIAHVWNSLCSDRRSLLVPSSCAGSDSAIWARAGAVIEPGSGAILVATGNGPFDGHSDWGDSVLELAPDASGLLHNWTPVDQAQLNADDEDLGSTAPALLPGTSLALQGGKAGVLDLLDLDRLDGTTGAASSRTGGELQQLPAPGSDQVFTAPAVATIAGRVYVFVADNSGTAAYVLGRDDRLSVAWQDSTPGTSPVRAGGLLYVYDQRAGALVVRRPAAGAKLISLPAGSGHWNSPIVVGGRIILPEGDYMNHASSGVIDIWHLPGH